MTVEQVDAQFKLVEQIHDLRAEIERLRVQVHHNYSLGWDEAIEECAKVAERYLQDRKREYEGTAAAIRALKDKP